MSRRKRFDEPDDQRIKRRFAIDEELRYKLLSGDRITEAGTGRVQNISSDGICFTTDAVLDYGARVEVSVNWPARLDHVCPMQLIICGRVVRSNARGTAVSMERYEFRTRGSAAGPLYEAIGIRLPT